MPTVHTFSSREFTRDVSAAKRAAHEGPVFITDRGEPAYALITIEEYHRLTGQQEASLLDLMNSLPSVEDVEFDIPQLRLRITAADLS